MSAFTTRPEILGTFGVVASTHWIASAVGMSMLEKGGNAFDAAVAAGFVLQVVEPHLVGPGGDMPAIIYSAKHGKVEVICAQGPAPAAATIEHYRAQGLKLIPGDGLLATVIPGSFDGWMLMLRDYGRLSVRDVLEPAIYYAEHGHPVLPRVADIIAGLAAFFEKEWPTSHEIWLPGGKPPAPHSNFRNPALAQTWKRVIAEAEGKRGREAQVEAARAAFYRGFVAEAIQAYLDKAEVMDASGDRHKGVLTANDMATWSASVEAPADLRLPWLDRRQDRTMGTGARLSANALDPEGHRPGFDGSRRCGICPHRDGGHETRLCRSRGLLRRPEFLRCAARRICCPIPMRQSAEASSAPRLRWTFARAGFPASNRS